MDILIGLIPALAWGLMPISAAIMGGKPSNQLLGTTMGAFIAGICVFIWQRPDLSAKIFWLSFLSGSMWAVGQLGQYSAFPKIGVSKTMPISSGLQLIGTSLIGVFVFGEWVGLSHKVIGFIALFIVVVGIALTSYTNRDGDVKEGGGKVHKAALLMLFLTTFGFLVYTSIPAVLKTSGMSIFFPQSIGMLSAAVVYVLVTRQFSVFTDKTSWKNIISGFLFGTAAITYIISAGRNGIATGFVLSQLSVAIATIGGIIILKERKTRPELIATTVGLIMVLGGAITTAFL